VATPYVQHGRNHEAFKSGKSEKAQPPSERARSIKTIKQYSDNHDTVFKLSSRKPSLKELTKKSSLASNIPYTHNQDIVAVLKDNSLIQ
jgi:hypothetical protein